ncbi:MAG: ribosomal protection-like ABC-F family protein [Dehalococcoidia bacterium]
MIIADLASISRVHGGRTIFRDLSWALQDGEKIGLVGPSGWGKTTLLKVLAGVDAPDAGVATLRRGARVAYLPQEFTGQAGRSAFEELLASSGDLAALEERLTATEQRMADPATLEDPELFDRILHEHADLLEAYEKAGGGAIRNRAEALLRSLGFDEDAWNRPMELLSGGQRKLIGIARCLLAEPDLLLLDEPDNHLDLDRKAMLEQVIRQFPGCVVVISHDRYLLDEVANVICELDYSRENGIVLRRWEGNYTSYVSQKELALLRQQQDYVAQQKEVARLEAAIARFKLWASIVIDERHIKQARNKQRQIDSMDKVERPVLERRKMRLAFRPSGRGGTKTLELRHLAKAFGEKIILMDANDTILNGERIGIVGPNGAGKSVLLKLILGQLPADEGEVWTGPSVKTGYYAQEHETLNMRQTPVEAIREVKPMYEGEAVAQLQRFLLPYDACSQPISKLSGGEKSRVQLARLMQLGANCLILDEPTNNLDIPAAEVLEESLEAFPGTVIVVSHDRYLLDRLVDRVIEVRDGEIRSFEGGYSYYLEKVNAPPVADTISEAKAGERARQTFEAKRRR